MLMPKKVKHRRRQKGRLGGKAWRGGKLSFGDFGLKSLVGGRISNRQIEAARVAITRTMKRGGKVWIRIFPDMPITKKPLETRMGKGKGPVEGWVAKVRAGRILFEVEGLTPEEARRSLWLASQKLALRCRVVGRSEL